MKRITFAGSVIVDIIKTVDCYPRKSGIANITSTTRNVGGLVPNTAIDLKVLDNSVTVMGVGKIGRDENGEFIRKTLESYGVIPFLSYDDDLPTSYTDVISEKSGERTFFCSSGANATFTPDCVPKEAENCDIFHLGYLTLLDGMDEMEKGNTVASSYLARLRESGVKTSIDMVSTLGETSRNIVRSALPFVDYIIVNELEAQEITGVTLRGEDGQVIKDNLTLALKEFFNLGVNDTAVIHCPELGCAMDKEGNFALVPSLSLPDGFIKGAVGAGDAFCAGMLYSFLTDKTLEEGLRLGSLSAVCNLSAVNSIDGAKNLAETLEYEKQFIRRKI